ncbi:uncharacterized protein LOC125031499 [Penaeus chinensis]|uniref:uncharacterized protein LOC125031499 n=1 Tax=Penaeus chinensis TaxID=139456 RepID=UPI001FB81FFB|nr:uncharacterized protein LOC125031499 [Penaeus chinensis]
MATEQEHGQREICPTCVIPHLTSPDLAPCPEILITDAADSWTIYSVINVRIADYFRGSKGKLVKSLHLKFICLNQVFSAGFAQIICFSEIEEGSALRWVRFHVPTMVERGEDVTLTCEFDLAGEKLYSVKWYKAGREFYRFVPADWPSKQDFEQKGVIVDTDRSDSQKVALKGITVDSSGRYKCEVLTEAPQFKTLVRSGFLTVFELPEGRPEVMGGQPQYRPGDTVNLTCRAPTSIPPANLTWYINEKERSICLWIQVFLIAFFLYLFCGFDGIHTAPPNLLVPYRTPVDVDGRASSRLGLRFKAQQLYFPDGRVRLRCVASIPRGERGDEKPLYAQDAHHEGVVVPPDPLSLGHDAGGALGLHWSGGGQMRVLLSTLVSCVMTRVLGLPNSSLS